MKTLFKLILFLVVAGGAATYFGTGYLLDKATTQALPEVKAQLEKSGMPVGALEVGNARLSSYDAISWYHIRAEITPPIDDTLSNVPVFSVAVDRATLQALSTSLDRFRFELSGVDIRPVSKITGGLAETHSNLQKGMSEGRLEITRFETPLSFDPKNPMEALSRIVADAKSLVRTGESIEPFSLSGNLLFNLKGQPYEIAIRTDPSSRRVVLDEQQLEAAAPAFSTPLNAPEIKIIARYPLRAPRLLAIKENAEVTSHAAATEDPSIPEDAYRCVLWSWLLSKEYGAKFAKTVTDAHEEGMDAGSPKARKMDLTNYIVGRSYAANGVEQAQILPKILKDPNVILNE